MGLAVAVAAGVGSAGHLGWAPDLDAVFEERAAAAVGELRFCVEQRAGKPAKEISQATAPSGETSSGSGLSPVLAACTATQRDPEWKGRRFVVQETATEVAGEVQFRYRGDDYRRPFRFARPGRTGSDASPPSDAPAPHEPSDAGTTTEAADAAEVAAEAPPCDSAAGMPLVEVPRTPLGEPIVEVRHVSTAELKPPGRDLKFDVTLRNDRATGRWFLFPHRLPQDGWLRPMDRLERTRLHGVRGVVLIGRSFLDFNLVFLPPGGVVTIRYSHTWTVEQDLPDPVRYEVVTASEVYLGDEPAAVWFEEDPTVPTGADVEDDRWQIGRDDLPDHESPTGHAVPVRIVEDRRVTLSVPLDHSTD